MIVCFMMELIGIAYERARLPQLRGQPLALAADDATILCASMEAQILGVSRGLKTTTARSFCRGLTVLPYDRVSYMEAAETVWDVIAVETSIVEPVDPEICYAEFSGRDIYQRASQVGASIAQHTGGGVRVGIGETKMIAHAAAQRREKLSADPVSHAGASSHGESPVIVTEATPDNAASLVAPILLESFPGLPQNLLQKLAKLGIRTLGDIRTVPKAEIERMAARPVAHRLYRLAAGQDDDPVHAVWPRREIEACVTFEDEVSLEEPIAAAIKQCAEKLAGQLRSQYCRTVTLRMRSADGAVHRETERLSLPASNRDQLTKAGLRLFARLYLSQPILKVHLSAGDIDAGGGVQLTLLDMNDSNDSFPHERRKNLDSRVKTLRRKYGPASVISATLMQKANQIGLWTYDMAKRRDERVAVSLDDNGKPIRYARMNAGYRQSGIAGEYQVTRVLDQWRSTGWNWGEISEVDCYRVFTEPEGTYELHRLGNEWKLRAVHD